MEQGGKLSGKVSDADLAKLQKVPVEDLVEAFNDRAKGDALAKRFGVHKDALLHTAEEKMKKLIEGLIVVNRV